METRIAAALAFDNMKNGIVPVVFGSQKPKEKPKNRLGIISISLLVSMFLFSILPLLWCFGYFQHRIEGKVFPGQFYQLTFYNLKSGESRSCFSDRKGEFALKLNKGVYKITLEGKSIRKEYSKIESTPFRMKVLQDLNNVSFQVVR